VHRSGVRKKGASLSHVAFGGNRFAVAAKVVKKSFDINSCTLAAGKK
jgi:hypothetical protein